MSALIAPSRTRALLLDVDHDALWYTRLNQLAAMLLLLLLSPVMLVIACCIGFEDGSPLTYGHWRVGHRGRLFRCLKFRSMVRDADAVLGELLMRDAQARLDWERDQKLRDDPRILGIGQLLRKTSLDELPQLFNVLRGEMHLVGPRPVTVQEIVRYGEHKRHYFSVKPGMTGLWQVSGRNNLSYAQRVALDVRYVESRTPWIDLAILLRTVRVLLTRDGAC